MTTRRTLATALGLTTATLGAGLAAAAPASAGGIAVIASPSFDNSCANSQSTDASGPTRHGAGTASGLRTQLPADTPLNHCGGADLPCVNDVVEALALASNINHIHLYSSNFGPADDGETVDGPKSLAREALLGRRLCAYQAASQQEGP
ncbi:hypothetical protein [Streptomyces noursei]